jgi:predicted metalloendopeptidase
MTHKYSQKQIEEMLEAIAQHGTNRAGYEALGVSKDTFYRLKKENPDFCESVAEAKRTFRSNLSEETRDSARQTIHDLILHGNIEEWHKEKLNYNDKGELLGKEITKTHVKRLPPPWAYELALGKPQSELDSLKNLAEAGWISDEVVSQALAKLESFEGDMKRIVGGKHEQV